MTDFGRRVVGAGDMLKSVYDPDLDGVIAVAQTEADMKKTVYDPALAAIAATLADHDTQHESGGTDEISVVGLLGTTPRAILGDAAAVRVLRAIYLIIANGTTGPTLKCTVTSRFNGDEIAETDNIAKNATTGSFTLSSDGQTLTIEAAGLSGNVLFAMGVPHRPACGANIAPAVRDEANDIWIRIPLLSSGAWQDITTEVNVGTIALNIAYITDA